MRVSETGFQRVRGWDYPGLGTGGLLLLAQLLLCAIRRRGAIRWLAVAGMGVGFCALLVLVIPVFQFKRVGGVAKGDIFPNTTIVVKTGLYAVVRHPQFTAGWVLAIALAAYSQTPTVVVLGLMAIAAFLVDFRRADSRNIEKFGESYVDYMKRVPGWNPVAGIWRLARRR